MQSLEAQGTAARGHSAKERACPSGGALDPVPVVRVFLKASTGRDAAPPDERGTSADLGRVHSRSVASCVISRDRESVVRASSLEAESQPLGQNIGQTSFPYRPARSLEWIPHTPEIDPVVVRMENRVRRSGVAVPRLAY